MADRHQQQWEALGADDPYWAVLTDPTKKNGKWNKADFFQTGQDEVDGLLKKISQLGIQCGSGLAMDYGCGVGRLSRALAGSFQNVIGVDISNSMLLEARSANSDAGNIQFLQNNGKNLAALAEGTVDLIYSNIVLQHSPRTNQKSLIKEFCRVLRPGGTLVFQTPSHENMRTAKGLVHFLLGNRVLNVARRMRYGKHGVMETHTLSQAEVSQILERGGMRIIEIERYDSAGAAFVSYRYFAQKC